CPYAAGASCAVIVPCVLADLADYDADVPDIGWTFFRGVDMINFFRNIAVINDVCTDFISCTYDPFDAAPPDASPASFSNADGQFVGPDGYDYIWTYFPSAPWSPQPGTPGWLVVRRDRDPAGYQLVLDYNQCTGSGAPDGGLADGDAGAGGGTDASTDDGGLAADAFVQATMGPGPQSPNTLCQLGTTQPWLAIGAATGDDPTRVKDGSTQSGEAVHVACTVQPSGSGFDVDLSATLAGLQGGSLTITSPSGQGAVTLASGATGLTAVFQSAQGGTYQSSDCTLTFQYQGGPVPDSPAIAPGRIWGHVSCPAAQRSGQTVPGPDGGMQARQCDGEADFLFEDCGGV
ncbi:MAG TPA: hypothetical protein VIY73_20020, partial [Polyangiaceae bacterium]